MRSRLLVALLSMSVLVGGACTETGELGGPAIGGSTAVVVDDTRLTHSELAELVNTWASEPEFMLVVMRDLSPSDEFVVADDLGKPASRPTEVVNVILNLWVLAEQGRSLLGDDWELTIAQEVRARVNQYSEGVDGFKNFDDDTKTAIAQTFVLQGVLAENLGQGARVDVDVEVSSRYGTTSEAPNGIVGIEASPGPFDLD